MRSTRSRIATGVMAAMLALALLTPAVGEAHTLSVFSAQRAIKSKVRQRYNPKPLGNFVKDCNRLSSHRVRCRYEFFPRHGGFAICDGRGLATYRRHQAPDVELTRPHNVNGSSDRKCL
jgi:hypothetical protein